MQDMPPEIAAVLAKTKERFQVQLSERLVEFDDILCDLEAGGEPRDVVGQRRGAVHRLGEIPARARIGLAEDRPAQRLRIRQRVGGGGAWRA